MTFLFFMVQERLLLSSEIWVYRWGNPSSAR